jgi:hypothetical protein
MGNEALFRDESVGKAILKTVISKIKKPKSEKCLKNSEASKRWLSMYCAANLYLQRI